MEQPKPIAAYHMTEPKAFGNSYRWDVTISEALEGVLYSVDGANFFFGALLNIYTVYVDPRFHYEDVWLAMDEALAEAARDLQVADTWGDAIDSVFDTE